MASRVSGAGTALAAAALLAVSLATSAWWAGHPTINGQPRRMQDIFVGLHGAELCNTGGDGTCKAMPLPAGFETIAYAELATTGLLILAVLAMAALVWTRHDRRRTLAKLCVPLVGIAGILAGFLLIQGPSRQAAVPVGFGMYVFWAGAGLSIIASVLALRELPLPRMQLAPARQSAAAVGGLASNPRVDLDALKQEDQLRPSQLRPEPMLGRAPPSPGVQSPGGILPGPSGPLGALGGSGPKPLFASAPQLRPLYEATPNQGGTGGFVPRHAAPIAMAAPAPVPRHQISAHAGIPTPASIQAQRPVTVAGVAPGSPLPQIPMAPRGKGPSVAPPPAHSSSPSSARPSPTRPPPARSNPTLGAAVAPPPPNATLAQPPRPAPLQPGRMTGDEGKGSDQDDRDQRDRDRRDHDQRDRDERDSNEGESENETIDREFDAAATYAVDPVPAPRKPPAPSVPRRSAAPSVPPRSVAPSVPPRNAAPNVPPRNAAPSVPPRSAAPSVPPRSAAPSAPLRKVPFAAQPATPASLLVEREEIDTDLQHQAVGEHELPSPSFETSTEESTAFEPPPRSPEVSVESTSMSAPPRPATATATAVTMTNAPPPDDDELMTMAREKISITGTDISIAVPGNAPPGPTSSVIDAPLPPRSAAPTPAPIVTPPPEPAPPAKISMSTALDSLPPPSEKQAASSGPSPACPQCESPMAWVEAHLRFYCKSCKMYF